MLITYLQAPSPEGPDIQGIPRSEIILKDESAIWITELEKILTKKGYTVLSREKLEEIVREKNIMNLSKAADLLGADAIVQINSMEYNDNVSLDQFSEIRLKFFTSDPTGRKFEVAHIDQALRNEIVEYVTKKLERDPNAYMGILDAKIINAKSGEIIWFYRNLIFKHRDFKDTGYRTFYLFKQGSKGKWRRITPKQRSDYYGGDEVFTSEVDLKEFKGAKRNSSDIVRFEIIKLICEDFVNRF